MIELFAKLRDHREVARRINAQTSEVAWLRGALVELIGILIGEPEIDEHLDRSGARFPPPASIKGAPIYTPAVVRAPPTPPPAGMQIPAAAAAVATPVRRPLTIAEALALAAARRAGPAASPTSPPPLTVVPSDGPPPLAPQPAPDPNVPDPAGPNFLKDIQRQIDAQEASEETAAQPPTGA